MSDEGLNAVRPREICTVDQEAWLRQQLWTLVKMTRNLLTCADVGAQEPALNGALAGAVDGVAWEIILGVFCSDPETIQMPEHKINRVQQRTTHVHMGPKETKSGSLNQKNEAIEALRSIINSALALSDDKSKVDPAHILEGLSVLKAHDAAKDGE